MLKLEFCNRDLDRSTKEKAEKAWDQLLQRKDLGFLELPSRDHLWTSSHERAQQILSSAKTTCFVGMGGSALGGRTLQEGLAPMGGEHQVLFFDNIDAWSFWQRLDHLDLEQTHWVFISKSGGTMETLAMADFASQRLEEKGLNLAQKSTVISEPRENVLTKWAKQNDVPVLEIPVDVGGRFSVLTPVGLLPAAMLGVDLNQVRQGAQWSLEQKDLTTTLAAHTMQSFERGEWITLHWIYSETLKTFGAWLQQLWAESLAKDKDLDGQPAQRVSSPFFAVGASDQHSILQQVAEGARDKFVWFWRDGRAEAYGPQLNKSLFQGGPNFQDKTLGDVFAAEAAATIQALDQMGISALSLRVEEVNAQTMGALFMSMELLIGCIGEILNIDAYNQPGVELGKKLAKEILAKPVV